MYEIALALPQLIKPHKVKMIKEIINSKFLPFPVPWEIAFELYENRIKIRMEIRKEKRMQHLNSNQPKLQIFLPFPAPGAIAFELYENRIKLEWKLAGKEESWTTNESKINHKVNKYSEFRIILK